MKINVLDPKVYNRISAGEVVEKPASIVKELVENSIDAGAKNIRIDIAEGGIKNICVSDDGCGIEKEDLTVAFLPHATSKIKEADDLDNIESLGFRGEALASISAVCQVKLSSKTPSNPVGYSLSVDGGVFGQVKEVSKSDGTTVSCSNLFFNTPVRAKFLRKPKSEEAEITHLVERLMLANCDINFNYYVDGKLVYNTPSNRLDERIYLIYGREVFENLVKIDYQEDGKRLEGYVTKPKVCKSNRTYQTLFVNNRMVENYIISNAVQSVFDSFLMKGKFPVYVLSLTVPSNSVDVNVHPSKKEVKFDNPNRIYSLVRKAVENALLSVDQIQNFILPENETPIFQQEDRRISDGVKLTEKQQFDIYHALHNTISKSEVLGNGEGRSFSIDFFDRDEKLLPQEDIILNAGVKEDKSAKNIIDELKNVTLEDGTKALDTTFYFDQSGEKFSNQIMSEQKFLKASVKDEMKILGTIFKTYIAIELDDAIYFIDQHAAHERLLYDKLVKQVDGKNVVKQGLLSPYTFSVGAKEADIIDNMLEGLSLIGFDIERNGNEFSIVSIPLTLSYIELDKFVDELVREGRNWDCKASDFIHSKLCQSACKHAIKAGDTITNDEAGYIIEEVRKGVMLCPHGRPITLVITKTEFEKMFKRIV